MHNVRLDQIEETKEAAAGDPSAARLDMRFDGEWRTDRALPQFGGVVKFPQGEILFEADFPSFLGGEGRAPTPLAYCFYGAMCCYGATFATQAALAGVDLRSLRIGLSLTVDFHAALGLGDVPPLSPFEFHVEVETDSSDEEVQLVKKLSDQRCPAIWAMQNPVAYETTARKV